MKSRSLLPYCICLINLVTTAALKYALVGNSTTFKTGINTPEPPEEILWKHNGNKMVEFDGQQQKPFNPFIDRITLNWHTAELTIANLKYEDSGDYDVEVFANKKLHPASFQLEVIDPVPKPSISCKINAGGNATLTCSAEVKGPYTKLEFSWTPPGNEKSSSSLEIKLGDKQDSQVYECKVKTQLSEEVSSFTAKDCYTEETSAGRIAGIVVGLLIPILLVIVVVSCLYKKGCLFKPKHHDGGYDEEKQTQLNSANDVKENNGGGIEEERRLLVREETMPSTQPLYQRNTASKNQQDESPSVLPQPPLKPSRSIVSPSKSQTHNEESEVNGDAKEKEPESDPLPSEKAADVDPEKNQHEIPSSPPQPPLKPSRSIVSPSRSQTHNKEGKVNGDAEEKGPESEPLPSEKTTDVEPGSQQNQHEIISPLLTVPVEQHNTEDPHAKEAIKETEAKVSESAPSGLEQKTVGESMNQDQTESSHPPPVAAKPSRASYINRVYKNPAGEEDSEKKKEEVSFLTSVQSSTSVPPTDTKEAVEQEENPKENSSGIDFPVSKETAVVLPDLTEKQKTESSHPPPVAAKPSRASYINRVYKNPAGEEDSEKKKEEVSSLTSVPSRASVPPTDTKEAVEQAENPKENSSGIDPPVSKETAVVLPDLTEKQKTESSHPPPVAAKPSRASYINRGFKNPAGEEDSEKKKKEEVSSLTSVPSSTSVPPTDTKEAAEQEENPKENSSGIDPAVSKETAVVLPGSDVVGDEHKQPKCSADTSVSAPAEPPASPVTQNVPKTPPNEAVEPEGNGFTGPASPEPSERKAEQPEVKDSQNIIEVKTPPPPTPEPNPAGAGTQTGAGQQEKDKRVPPAEEEESQKENSHLIDHEQDEGHNSEPEESFQTPPCSPKRSPKEAKVGSDSSSGEDQSKEDEGEAALSEPKHSQ
ncbi:proteoglycan 4-like isoform X2 [Oryzias latipes]|uniref:proteoglycan 4-like isoform X2 n=1 Tax=Oryzias latipes TaxID=8090 RepID=UPI000CE1C401|nr:proteoglycan 4-like isoform X2 [Oryzias latipes]